VVSRSDRQAVASRARGCCEYCRSQARYATEAFSIEHIQPLSREGADDIDNLALACQGCNGHKYNKVQGVDPISGEALPLFHPRRQR
jgi:5-methylcytosine-specific restriction endonuclease McrA